MRKQPKQSRSRALVESLIDATGEVIIERGLESLTTNQVAERAGVSVGSLYQYFPDKQALLLAVLDRMESTVERALADKLQLIEPEKQSLNAMVTLTFRIGMAALRENPLHLALLRHWQTLPVNGPMRQLEKFLIGTAQTYFIRHLEDYPVRNLHPKLYVLINSVILLLSQYMSEENPPITEPELESVLVTMICVTLLDDGPK